MKKRSKIGTLLKMLTLVKPLTGFMVLAVTCGTLAYLAVQFIPISDSNQHYCNLGLSGDFCIATLCSEIHGTENKSLHCIHVIGDNSG